MLVEVHDEAELERALKVPGELVGINNRDLHRFVTDLETTLRLAPMVPKDRLVVSESGNYSREDVKQLKYGVGRFLEHVQGKELPAVKALATHIRRGSCALSEAPPNAAAFCGCLTSKCVRIGP